MAFERERPDPSRPWNRGERGAAWSGLDQANIMGVELIAATLTWAGIGFLLDRWLGTTPWLLVVGALAGNAAGIYLIWLRSNRMEGGSAYTGGSTYAGSAGSALAQPAREELPDE